LISGEITDVERELDGSSRSGCRFKYYEKLIAAAGLCRIKISLFAAASAVAGFLLAPEGRLFPSRLWSLTAGVIFLAFGASALNQLQEAATDALMPRTRGRPIPSCLIRPGEALLTSIILMATGASILFLSGGHAPAALGGLAIFWYNLIYTPLKRVTEFAFIPGALVGSIPPAIGFVYGGGVLWSPKALIIFFFFYIWQIPHFLLFLLRYGKEYERAGLPCITNVFRGRRFRRIIFIGEVSAAASAILLMYSGEGGLVTCAFAALAAAWMVGSGAAVLLQGDRWQLFAWRSINACVLIITFLAAAGRM
jgi:protoheme IX farnesyltransferase